MDVTLPNGVVLIGVPDGATKDQVREKAVQAGLAKWEDFGEYGSAANPAAQGLTFGLADELIGALGAVPASFELNHGIVDKIKGIPDAYRGLRDQVRTETDNYSKRNPKTALAAEVGGGLLTGGVGAGRSLVGATGRELVEQSAKLGAKMGAVSGAGYSEADDATGVAMDTLQGAGLGAVGGAMFPAAGQGLAMLRRKLTQSPAASAQYAKQVGLLADEGINLTSGQRLGSDWQRAAEHQLAQVPVGGTPLQRTFEGQQRQLQKSLLRMAGLDDGADMITRETLEATKASLSRKYDSALKGKVISISDDSFLDDLAQIEAKHKSWLPFEQKKQVSQIIDDVLQDASENGAVSGERYQQMRSFLTQKAKSTTNSYQAGLYDDLRNALDSAFERVAGSSKREVDSQYARFKQLEKIFNRTGGPKASEGFISPVQLAKEAAGNPGGADWQDFTRAASSVLPDRMPNSGTAQRSLMAALMTGGAVVDPVLLGQSALAARMLSRQMANGTIDVTRLLPSGALLSRPQAAAPAALAGLLAQ